jgi:hypothetical protein
MGMLVETLVVILGAIVLAGILARACGGRHVAPTMDHDIEGWVEHRRRSCLDSGLPPPGASKVREANSASTLCVPPSCSVRL